VIETRISSALIVGIDRYGNGIAPLHSATRDARAVAAELETQHGYQVTLLLDAEASASAIAAQLEDELPKRMSAESCLLFYYAGHGIARGDGDSGPQGFLIPHGADPRDQDTWLSMERVRAALSRLPCTHLLVILDCCFAGSFRWSSTRDAFFSPGPLYDSQYQRYLKGVAWQALTSASHDEKALDLVPGSGDNRGGIAGDGHSPFAAALLRGLQGEADTARVGQAPDGVITATELYQYIFDQLVPADAESHQTPGIWPLKPDNTGQYVFHSPLTPRRTLPDPPLDPANNPWCGLRAYEPGDAPLFFGRERVVAELLQRVCDPQHPRLLAVVGASGTGKSSVVKAGLLPRLQALSADAESASDRWRLVQCERLGADPLPALRAAQQAVSAADPAQGRRLLLIDQFEELYTRCHSAPRREEFLQALRTLIDSDAGVTVVLSLRSDFEPRPADSAALRDLWGEARYLIPALTIEEFRDCILGPAQVKALYFEPDDLVDDLLEEVMSMPGALPTLSFALAELYRHAQLRRRDSGANDRAITRADYLRCGGVVGSLHRRAGELFEHSDAATQATIKRVFLRLLNQDGARLSRRRVSRQELAFAEPGEQQRVAHVLDEYVAARLLVADAEAIEPAHDTLIIAWEKLQDWLSEAGPQVLQRSLWQAARAWEQSRHSSGMLWHDNPQLPLALTRGAELNALEARFVAASARRRRLRRNTRLGIAASVALALFGFGSFALNQALEAEQARHIRDQTYLDIIEQGDFFDIETVLKGHAQGGVVQPADASYAQWRLLVDEPLCGFDAQGAIRVEAAQCAFAIGRVYGTGRVIAIGHEALITYIDWSELDVLPSDQVPHLAAEAEADPRIAARYAAEGYGRSVFLDLALQWLAGQTEPGAAPRLTFTQGHAETLAVYHPDDFATQRIRLQAQGYSVADVDDLAAPAALADTEVLVIANAWSAFSDAEAAAVERFVAEGGGLLMAGLGWSWIENGPHTLGDQPAQALASYPMNRIAQPFNVVWTGEPIWTRSDFENADLPSPTP
jgi:hypothetical protein